MIDARLAEAADRRLAVRGHARGRPGLAGHARLPGRRRRRTSSAAGFADCAADEQAAIQAVQDLGRVTGTACPPAGSGACGPATRAPRSTPTPGPGTRSASPAPPTRAATRTRAWDGASRSRCADAQPRPTDPVAGGRHDQPVRERNESAWLLPNDGTRTNHRLRDDMRRFADDDEVDLVIVGCGAGGAHAAAAAGPARLAGGRRWTPGRSGTRTPTGSATRPARITCTGPSRGSSPAPTRCRSARTTPAAASAGRWCTTPATPRASTPATSRR